MKTIFQRIIDGELPADKVFENERIIAIKDINPQAPVHLLIITKKAIPSLTEITPEDGPLVAEVMAVATKLAKKFNVESGFRLLTNNGAPAGQTIPHLHFHLLGGRDLGALG